ncbi:hypothetical protein RvY_06722 [Ramazzottius varieornatus]|uniref:Uncharacterized protein n=1 Tax=Ramazzottius varieornatus TaxID=947166 RepID=A0A1D1UZK4_RAMVA|nr:hypothetical protein RvY_06722 [Ramazzottius varieornatus]
MATSSGPKTQRLMLEGSKTDVDFLLKVSQQAEQWAHVLSEKRPQVLQGVHDFITLCQARLSLWEKVFVACICHQYLPEEFHMEPKSDTKLGEAISAKSFKNECGTNLCTDYTKLIRWNKRSRTIHSLSH